MIRELVFGEQRWGSARIEACVAQWARWLAHQGVGPGARVAMVSANRPEMIWAFWACARLGAVFAPLNVRLTDSERANLLERLSPTVVVGASSGLPAGGSHLGSSFGPTEVEGPHAPGVEDPDFIGGNLGAGSTRGGRGHAVNPAAVVAALFSSGTTGVPKLIELTHQNFIANATASAANLGIADDDSWLGSLPLFHIGGLAMAYRCASQGCRLVLEPTFSAERIARLLESGEVTHASLVPTTLQRVLDVGLAFSKRIRAVLIGGGPMTPALLQRAREAGLPVLQTYGLTEACSQVCTEKPSEADGATAGPPLPGFELRITGEAEIEVRGEAVAGAPGRWLATGDLGALDSRGRLTVFSRRVDLIISGGENIYPGEIERVLAEHPAVGEVVVVPRDDTQWGQVPVACIVWKGPVDETVLDWARNRLAAFKVPKAFCSVAEIPRNANGKIERRALVAHVAQR